MSKRELEGGNGNSYFFKVCHQSREVLVKTQKMGFFEVMRKYSGLSVKTENRRKGDFYWISWLFFYTFVSHVGGDSCVWFLKVERIFSKHISFPVNSLKGGIYRVFLYWEN